MLFTPDGNGSARANAGPVNTLLREVPEPVSIHVQEHVHVAVVGAVDGVLFVPFELVATRGSADAGVHNNSIVFLHAFEFVCDEHRGFEYHWYIEEIFGSVRCELPCDGNAIGDHGFGQPKIFDLQNNAREYNRRSLQSLVYRLRSATGAGERLRGKNKEQHNQQ